MSRISIFRFFQAAMLLAMAASGHSQTIAGSDTSSAQRKAVMEPGLWQVNTRPEMRGGQMMVLPRNARICITDEDVNAGRIPLVSMPACQVQEGGVWEGEQLTLKMECKGLPKQSQYGGTLKAQAKAFQGQIDVVLVPDKDGVERGHMVYHQTGTWVAAQCPSTKVPGASQAAQ